MNHNIGSKQAEKLARERLGPRAYAMRSGRRYYVGKIFVNPCRLFVGNIVGVGKSWSEALKNAGIELPKAENGVNGANVPTPEDIDKLVEDSMPGGEE